MNDLIKINYDSDRPTVSGRELHEFLEVTERFQSWFNRNLKYGFEENVDYVGCKVFNTLANQELQDYQITIDMAKEISMIQRNEKGKQARQYFIQLEKDWNSPEVIMARALQMADKKVLSLSGKVQELEAETVKQAQLIGEMKPKATYYDLVLRNKGLVAITQIAKDYGMSGQQLNAKLHELGVQYKLGKQWLLYAKFHNKGYTHSETIHFNHSDGRPDTKLITKWTQSGRLFLYDLLKSKDILPVIEQDKTA